MSYIIIFDIVILTLSLIGSIALVVDQLENADILNLFQGKHFVYWFFTAGLVDILLLFKAFYGVLFLWQSSRSYERSVAKKVGRISMQVNETQDQLRHKTRKLVLKGQRRQLNRFFIASTVYYIFSLILVMCLIPIAVAIDAIERFSE